MTSILTDPAPQHLTEKPSSSPYRAWRYAPVTRVWQEVYGGGETYTFVAYSCPYCGAEHTFWRGRLTLSRRAAGCHQGVVSFGRRPR